jgi:HAD superfamily hydrolase (TIGR01509 family)
LILHRIYDTKVNLYCPSLIIERKPYENVNMKKLVIFDCDGTLVDSEYLYNSITASLLNGLGLDEYTPQRCIADFAGHSWTSIRKILAERHGTDIPRDIVDQYIVRANQAMHKGLKASDHAHDVLSALKSQEIPFCVASNGERTNVLDSLKIGKLGEFFPPDTHIFTKIQVPNPKPAPDLFLFAAENMGFAPSDCLVVEDSPTGVQAAVAANMDVLGFIGTAHDQNHACESLENAGATAIINSLIHIHDHMG